MAWRLSGDKQFSEPMMVSLLTLYASLVLNELNKKERVFTRFQDSELTKPLRNELLVYAGCIRASMALDHIIFLIFIVSPTSSYCCCLWWLISGPHHATASSHTFIRKVKYNGRIPGDILRTNMLLIKFSFILWLFLCGGSLSISVPVLLT